MSQCIVCQAKPTNPAFPGTPFCGNTCRLAFSQTKRCDFCQTLTASTQHQLYGSIFCSRSCMDAAERAATVSGFQFRNYPVQQHNLTITGADKCLACGIRPRIFYNGSLSPFCSASCAHASSPQQGQPLCQICNRAAYYDQARGEFAPGCTREHSRQAIARGLKHPR